MRATRSGLGTNAVSQREGSSRKDLAGGRPSGGPGAGGGSARGLRPALRPRELAGNGGEGVRPLPRRRRIPVRPSAHRVRVRVEVLEGQRAEHEARKHRRRTLALHAWAATAGNPWERARSDPSLRPHSRKAGLGEGAGLGAGRGHVGLGAGPSEQRDWAKGWGGATPGQGRGLGRSPAGRGAGPVWEAGPARCTRRGALGWKRAGEARAPSVGEGAARRLWLVGPARVLPWLP